MQFAWLKDPTERADRKLNSCCHKRNEGSKTEREDSSHKKGIVSPSPLRFRHHRHKAVHTMNRPFCRLMSELSITAERR
jgi:hypothetical protein